MVVFKCKKFDFMVIFNKKKRDSMVLSQEILLKQIKTISKLIGKILLNNEDFSYVLPESKNYSEFDKFYVQLTEMLDNNKINEAEDLLFKNIDGLNLNHLQIALSFYEKLAQKSEDELVKNNFSKEEVEQGFLDVLKLYNINVQKKN